MNTRQYLQLESCVACLGVLREPAFGRPTIEPLRAKLAKAVEEVRELSGNQVGAHIEARTGSLGLTVARKDVRKWMLRISRLATAVLDGVPGIRDDVRVPHANAKDVEVIKAAARIVRNLKPHMKTLYDHGLPKDALPRLKDAIGRLKAKSPGASTGIARRSRATASLPDAIRRARKFASALDTAIKLEFAGEKMLAHWAIAYRVPRKKGRPKKRRGPEVLPA